MKRACISALIFIISSHNIFGQKIQGMVYEKNSAGDSIPLFSCNVYWKNTTLGTTTAKDGTFMINYPSNESVLYFRFIGYEMDSIVIPVPKDTFVFMLLVPEKELNTVVVTAIKESSMYLKNQTAQTLHITEKELKKAACCNLSESFETTASVDVSFTDAMLGYRQIQMLGLEGKYLTITKHCMPFVRGISTQYGLSLMPGPWVESIQLSKGLGSVTNGFESMTGQINVELKNPETDVKHHLNGYINQNGRMEYNSFHKIPISKNLNSSLLVHTGGRPWDQDMNKDGFKDSPIGYQYHVLNSWLYESENGFIFKGNIRYAEDIKTGGNIGFDRGINNVNYGVGIDINQFEVDFKSGYVFQNSPSKSIGIQFSQSFSQHESFFGNTIYQAKQTGRYANLLFKDIIKNTDHQYTMGVSVLSDSYHELVSLTNFQRDEHVPGLFLEYTWTIKENSQIIAGQRIDYNSLFGWFYTPRLHVKHSLNNFWDIRISAGRGQRTANIFAENYSNLISSRQWSILSQSTTAAYGFTPEISWNIGGSIHYTKKINKHEIQWISDIYYTHFTNMIVKDIDFSATQLLWYATKGSNALSISSEIIANINPSLECKMAYRYYQTNISYLKGNDQLPLISRDKLFLNIAWASKQSIKKIYWKYDATISYNSPKRMPETNSSPAEFILPEFSPQVTMLNAQVSLVKNEKWEYYIGLENILNITQQQLIINPTNPWNEYFDASIVWGPIFGRMIYAGFRIDIR